MSTYASQSRNTKSNEHTKELVSVLRLLSTPIPKKISKTVIDIIPSHTIVMTGVVPKRQLIYEKTTKVVSTIVDVISKESYSPATLRWKYYIGGSNPPRIGDIVSIVSELTGADKEELSPPQYWDNFFRTANQLKEIVSFSAPAKQVILNNSRGGIDIVAKITSFSDSDKYYYVTVSTDPKNKTVYLSCSCPLGRKYPSSKGQKPLCKHMVAVVLTNLHSILKSLGISGSRIESALNKLDKLREVYDGVDEAFAYYIMKWLKKYSKIGHVELDYDEINKLFEGKPSEKYMHSSTQSVLVSMPSKQVYEVELTDTVKSVIRKAKTLIDELKTRFGLVNTPSEWAEALVFGIIASADYREPPVVLHAIGRPGTFKTYGATLLRRAVDVPHLVVEATGDPKKVYNVIINALKGAGLPVEYGQEGGLLKEVVTEPNRVSIYISLPHLVSLISSRDVVRTVSEIVDRLKRKGLSVRVVNREAGVRIVDFKQASNIEKYRYMYRNDPFLGIIRRSYIFGEEILLIDEASRDPMGLEAMLTKMSISSLDDSTRTIIMTDNLEPYLEVVREPRYAPLHDRTFKILTQQISDEKIVEKTILAPFKTRINMLEAQLLNRVMKEIPVPETFMFIAKAIPIMLSKKIAIIPVNDTVMLTLIDRETDIESEEMIVIEPLKTGFTYSFREGGRFKRHIELYTRFKALLNEKGVVTDKEFLEAVDVAVRSRLVLPEVRDYIDYKMKVFYILDSVRAEIEKLLGNKELVEKIARFIEILSKDKISKGDAEELRKIYNEIVEDATSRNPVYPRITIPALYGAVEQVLSNKPIDIAGLPDGLRETIIAFILERGDWRLLSMNREHVRKVIDILREKGIM